MTTILHGENTTASRLKLAELIDGAKRAETEVVRLDAKRITLADVEQLIGSSALFGQPRLVIIEELHSLPKSQRKNDLIKALGAWDRTASPDISLVLWEKRSLTATMLKVFAGAASQEFKLSSSLFKWLDSLRGDASPSGDRSQQVKLLHEALAQDDEYLCFALLCRQIRMLIQAKTNEPLKGAPFMITKLKKQAETFSLAQLLSVHRQLLEIDKAEKTSSSYLELSQQLDLLVVQM